MPQYWSRPAFVFFVFSILDASANSLGNKNDHHPLAVESLGRVYIETIVGSKHRSKLFVVYDRRLMWKVMLHLWLTSLHWNIRMMSVKIFFGKWIHSGSHPFTFKATFERDGNVFVEKCAPGASGNVFYLRRLHCCHPSNTDFRKMLAFVSGM